jgi:signal transduction histidine kinase
MADWISGQEDDRRWALFLRTQLPVAASVALLLAIVLGLRVEIRGPGWLLAGAALVAAATAVAAIVPWARIRPGAHGAVPLVDLVAIMFIALALAGTVDTVSALSAFPAIWLSFAFGVRGAAVAVIGVWAASIVPVLTIPQAGVAEWTTALIVPIAVSALAAVGVTVATRLRASLAQRDAAAAETERVDAVIRSVFREVDLGLAFLNEHGEPVMSNHALGEFMRLGRHRHDTGGTRVYAEDQVTPIPPEDQPLARMRRGEAIDDLLCWVGPRGGQRALLLNGRYVSRPDGRPAGSMLIAQDITDLLRAGRAREDALATLAHELRTPLTSIIGYSDLLLMGDLSAEATARVEVIVRNAEHLLALTAAFLDSLHGEVELHRRRVKILELVTESLEELQATPGFADRDVHVDVDPALTALADPQAVSGVLANLLSNAVKFSGPGDRITVAAGQDDTWVSLVVRNTGSRVDPADLERIFDRFYRGGNAQRDAVAGTGIGLSVSREIATAHGGTLTAEDIDDGASFKLCLPRD